MRALITGCSGYIASKLIPRLQQEGVEIVALDRAPYLGPPVDQFVQADLLEASQYEREVGKIDAVFHLAAAKGDWGFSEEEYFRDNARATEALLDVCSRRGIRKIFFFSTVGVLGPSSEGKDEASICAPVNPYGKSKLEAEVKMREYAERHSADVIFIRPSVVYGHGNPENTNIYRLIDSIHRRRFLMIGDGSALKTTSYIENLVEAAVFLLGRFRPGVQVFHYIDEPCLPTAAIVASICSALGRPAPRLALPLWAAAPLAYASDVIGSMVGVDFPITRARIEKFCTPTYFKADLIRSMGFVQRVSNDEAIARSVEWYRGRLSNHGAASP